MSRRPGTVLPLAVLLTAVLTAVGLPTSGTAGAWHDREEVVGGLAVRMPRDCTSDGRYAAVARARMLSGTLGPTDLGTVAGLAGLTVTGTGTSSSPSPAVAVPAGPDAWRDPLGPAAVAGLVSAGLAEAVQLSPAGQSAGVLGQYARAAGDGEAHAAAGAVGDSGLLLVGASGAGSGTLPGPAVVDLAALAPGVAGLVGARLEVGALAAGARLDGCARDEGDPWLVREHGVAGLALEAASPAVTTLRTTTQAAATSAAASLTALQTQLATTAAGTLQTLLGGTVQSSTASVAVDVPAVVAPFTSQRLSDGVVTVDLAAGTVRVDLAALSGGLDGRAPGSRVTLDPAAAARVAARVDALLTTWSAALEAAVGAALRAAVVTVDVRLSVPLLGSHQVLLTGTTAQLLAGTATVTAPPVLGAVAGPLLAALAPVVQLRLLGPGGTLPTLAGGVTAALPAVAAQASALTTAVGAAVGITVDVQEQPAGSATSSTADDVWSVTALRLAVLAGTRAGGHLDLATAVVGPVVELG